jgi:hypothetical protein
MDYNKEIYKYKGSIHIHTTFSDGSGNLESIVRVAQKAGLSWIIITDHNYFDFEEGIYNGVYVLKGEEISPDNKNHYLAIGIKNYIAPNDCPQVYIDEVRKQNGVGFAAHPDESGTRKNNYPPIVWDKTFIPDGVEIWNWFSSWADGLNSKNIFTLAFSYFFKSRLIKKAPDKSLRWWDELNSKSQSVVPAIGGVDAHALKLNKYIVPITVFPYDKMFKTINNVLMTDKPLSKDFKIAKSQILKAIKQGNNLVINEAVLGTIPDIEIKNEVKTAQCGETLELDKKTYLNVKVSKKALIKVILNGRELYECFAKKCNLLLTEIGKYRVEILINKKGFVYSNPIVVA